MADSKKKDRANIPIHILVYFNSWEDLQEKVKTTDYKAKTENMLNFAKKHHDKMLDRWNNIIIEYSKMI